MTEQIPEFILHDFEPAYPRSLRLPIVYNTSAYDALSSLKLMEGLVDIYMPDCTGWMNDRKQQVI